MKKALQQSLLFVLGALEAIPRRVWDFFGCVLIFGGAFYWVNSDIESNNILCLFRVTFGNLLVGWLAITTIPQFFFDMFDTQK